MAKTCVLNRQDKREKAVARDSAKRDALKLIVKNESLSFDERMAALDLKPVEFSILSVVGRNPGVTPSQLCAELAVLPPHLTKLLARLDKRQLLTRTVLASDKRAVCLCLSAAGVGLLAQAETAVTQLEADAASALTSKQLKTLNELLQKIY